LAQLEKSQDFSPEMKKLYENFKSGFQNCRTSVDRTVKDREELPFCGGIIVIHNPGHRPGHICFYHKPSKSLIAGDALTAKNGILMNTEPYKNFDHDLSLELCKKSLSFDIDAAICYHGGLCEERVNKQIEELVNKVN